MKSIRIFAFLAFTFSYQYAWACSPPPGFHFPSLRENFQSAPAVVAGEVKERETLKDGRVRLKVAVEKSWKKSGPKERTFVARQGNTCDAFEITAVKGAFCLLFADAQEQVLSGLYAGESSFCLPPDSPKRKNLIADYNARFPEPDSESGCTAKGGRWEGTEKGRGRLTGCNLPTSDGGKKCNKGEDCESVCLLDGTCHGWKRYKGCAYFPGREQAMCVD